MKVHATEQNFKDSLFLRYRDLQVMQAMIEKNGNVLEVAKLFGVSRYTIYRAISRNEIRAIRERGNS